MAQHRRVLGVKEVLVVAHAKGINMPVDSLPATIARLESSPPSGTSSMQRDLMEGRPSELEVQNGGVVRLGLEAGVPTPVNSSSTTACSRKR